MDGENNQQATMDGQGGEGASPAGAMPEDLPGQMQTLIGECRMQAARLTVLEREVGALHDAATMPDAIAGDGLPGEAARTLKECRMILDSHFGTEVLAARKRDAAAAAS